MFKETKENTSQILNGLQEDINKQLTEIKTIQDMKLVFNKDFDRGVFIV